MSALAFVKGHGTENDFVLVPDLDGTHELTPEQVRALADRRAGIGADGVIRVVRTAHVPEVAAMAGEAEWFMDYRNADGSVAEMCGNGTRVLVQYLRREHLVDAASFVLATRAGLRPVRVEQGAAGADLVATDLGAWRVVGGDAAVAAGGDAAVTVAGLPGALPALTLDLGNPHTVVLLPDESALSAADLSAAPDVDPVPPHGSNVELVVPLAPGHLVMRVHERGVGETRSCGTGAAAAALAARAWARAGAAAAGEDADAVPDEWRVDVPGGTLRVRVTGDRVELAGPAVLVADGTTTL